MKAYVARNRSGAITKGWLLRRGTSIESCMCRLPSLPAEQHVEEVSVEVAVRGAAPRELPHALKRLPAKADSRRSEARVKVPA